MALTYNNAIPQATDAFATSQPQILTNFASIESLIDVDHEDFASPEYGQHAKVTFPVQGSAPVFAAGSVGLYNLNSSLTTLNELFLTNSAGATYPITGVEAATTGWTYLPSGLLLKWGTSAGNGSTTIVFPVAATIPVFNNVFTAQVTDSFNSVADTNTYVRFSTFSTVSITVYCSSRTVTGAANTSFNWLVIGN